MARLARFVASLGLLLSAVGCGGGRYDVEVSFGPGITATDVRFVELLIVEQCPTDAEIATGQPPADVVARTGIAQGETPSLRALGRIPPGTYGLYARGLNVDCTVLAAGCAPVRLRDDGSGVLAVTLATTSPIAACVGNECMNGECVSPDGGLGDGGVDGSVPGDACGIYPCAADQVCTDLPDPAPVAPSGRTCAPVTHCMTGQYESVPPTATTDRLCATCAAACGGGLYESTSCADGDAPQNRVCTPLTICGTDQYQLTAPTATTDRVCGTCAPPCQAMQYESSACANGNGTTNRVCMPCHSSCMYCDGPSAGDCTACPPGQFNNGGCQPLTNCSGGQYQSVAPTATTDRVCGTCAVCTSSQYETVACANGNSPQNRACTSLSVCMMGEYQSTAPTLTSDRVCSTCGTCTPGQYESTACANGNAPQNRVCTPLTICMSGQYQSTAPTATSDRGCSACATCTMSQYESIACANGNAPQNRACTALTNCTTGQYESVAPTPTTNRTCATCAAPCGIGQYESTACANGNTPQNRACAACHMSCMNCTGPSSSECTGCGPGQFMNGTVCQTLTSCMTGQYESVAPTATTDRVCGSCTAACNASQYESTACANGNSPQNRVCTPLTTCTMGQYQVAAPTATSNRVCASCTTCTGSQYESSACADGNTSQNRVCTALTSCTTGQYQSVAPTATSNRVCSTCAATCGAGQYESTACANGNGTQNRVCTALTSCMTGQYQSVAPTATTDRQCASCAPACGSGFYESAACANGNTSQNRVCSPCHMSCTNCDGPLSSDCTGCGPTQWMNGTVCTALTNCTTGQYQSVAPTATSDRVCGTCTTCTGSQYQTAACANGNSPQNRVCTALTNCMTGQYQSVAPTATSDRMCSSCASCNAGQYESTACANGNTSQNRVCTSLTNCSTGQYQSMAPTATTDRMCSPCATCSAGQYESTACANGNTSQNRVCSACDAVTQCATGLSCTGPGTSQCTSCNGGFMLVNNAPPTPDMCVGSCGSQAVNRIAAGRAHTCAVLTNGQLWCWGDNSLGQLGQGNVNVFVAPVRVGSRTDWNAVAAGWDHTCAIRASGILECWGSNANGQLGRGGTASSPGQVTGSGWGSVAAGSRHTCGGHTVCTTSNVNCWGANNVGQLGNGNTTQQSSPAVVAGSLGLCAIAAGGNATTGHSAFDQNLTMYYSGVVFGRSQANSPAMYGTAIWNNAVTMDAGGEHTCVIFNGGLYCGGVNGSGQLGLGDTTSSDVLARVGAATDWSQVSGGDVHSCGRRGGTLYCWGENGSHQAGNSGTGDYLSPTQIGSDTTWTQISAGVEHTCAVRGNVAYCWGSNADNRSGLGVGAPDQTSPVTPVCFP